MFQSNYSLEYLKKYCENLFKEFESDEWNDFLTNTTYDSFYRFTKWYNKKINNDEIYFESGATKAVICDINLPFVIKIPLFVKDFDACKVEWRNYKEAEKQNLDSYFAWIEKLMDYNDCPIYVMEKVEIEDEDMVSQKVCDYFVENDFENERYSYTSEDSILVYAESEWGADYQDMLDFLDENFINDLHAGNIGWIDDRMVLIDYSGYGNETKIKNVKDWWSILKN